MYKQEWVNQRAAKTRGEAGATPPCRKIAAPVPPGFGGHSRLVLLKTQLVFWPRACDGPESLSDTKSDNSYVERRRVLATAESTTQTTQVSNYPNPCRRGCETQTRKVC